MSFDIQSQMQNNLAQFCLQLKDNLVFFKDIKGIQYQGIVSNITPSDKTIIFREFEDYLSQNKQNNKKIKFSDLSSIHLSTKPETKQIFKTDGETSKQKRDREKKTLVKWNEHDNQENVQLDHGQQSIHFDQFEANQEKFGVTATYDEDSYTTHLKIQQIDEHLKNYADLQVNAVIQNSSLEKNRHLLEERNLKPLQDKFEEDEEAKYSAVMGAGNYKQPKQKKKKNHKQKNDEEEKSLKALPPPGLGKFFNSKVQEPVIELPQPPKKIIRTKSDGLKKKPTSPQEKVSSGQRLSETRQSADIINLNISVNPDLNQELSQDKVQTNKNETQTIKKEKKPLINPEKRTQPLEQEIQEKIEVIQTLANIAPPPQLGIISPQHESESVPFLKIDQKNNSEDNQPKKQESKKPLRLTAAPLTNDLQQNFQQQKQAQVPPQQKQQKKFDLEQLAPQNIAKEIQNSDSTQEKKLKLQSRPYKYQQPQPQYPPQQQFIPQPQQGYYEYDQTYYQPYQQPYFYPQQYNPQQWYYPQQYQPPPPEYSRQQK